MKEIGVGIRIDPREGLSFHGIEEVNALLNFGGVVTKVEPGGAIMRKLGDDGQNVRLTLGGCELKIFIDDAAVDTSPKWQEHRLLFEQGSALIKPYMQLINREQNSPTTPAAIEMIDRGISLLRQTIVLNPANFAAYWIIGKAYQALGNAVDACEAFEKSYGLNRTNPDVAREYMYECLKLGETRKAINAARHAASLQPDNAGLHANLGLALLIGGELNEAATAIEKALAIAPHDEIARNLEREISEIRAGRRPQPANLADLERK